ncbi:MAG: tetratricopeptide repeat protein [Spirochaetales bacterium]
MSRQTDALANIYFIEIPDHLADKAGELPLDTSRKLPVEYPPDGDPRDRSSLTWEMIISGMLKILAYHPDHEDADYYRRFITKAKPELIDELTETGVMKAKNSDFAIAEEIFLALRGLVPGNPLPILNLALLYEQAAESEQEESTRRRQREERAIACYREVLEHDEAPPEASFNAGFFYLRRSDHERALQLFERYLDETREGDETEDVEDADDEHYQTQERRAQAQKIVEEIRARELDDTLFKEAFDFVKLGREDDAIERIQRFIEKHPDVWNAWFILGWAQRRKSLYTEGRISFEKAIELGGGNPDTLNELAICLMETGNLSESLDRLKEALSVEPENTKVMSNIGIVLLKQGDPENALRFFHSVLEYDPNDPVALEYLKQLEEG